MKKTPARLPDTATATVRPDIGGWVGLANCLHFVRFRTPFLPHSRPATGRFNSLTSMNLRTELTFRNCAWISEGLPGMATSTVK